MARLTDKAPPLAVIGFDDLGQRWRHPRTGEDLALAHGTYSRLGNAAQMLEALKSPGLDALDEPSAIGTYERIMVDFGENRDVRAAAIARLDALIGRINEPHAECMTILLRLIARDSYETEAIKRSATRRLLEIVQPDDSSFLLNMLPRSGVDKLPAPVVTNSVIPQAQVVLDALGAVGDATVAKRVISFWEQYRGASWVFGLRKSLVWALVEIAQRARDLSLVNSAETIAHGHYPDHGADFAIGAARVACGDVERGIDQMIWRLDQSRSIAPRDQSPPESLIKAGIDHFDVLAPYLDEPRLAEQAGKIVERVLERAPSSLSDAQLCAIAARQELTGIRVWWDTSKDVYEVAREELVPVDFACCRALAAEELARRNGKPVA
jgi:hypothetical protein